MREIQLSQKQVALIDDEDFHKVSQYSWCALAARHGKFYAWHKDKFRSFLMHRYIVNAPSGIQVDHVNGNTLDNRKENLRFVTDSQNHANLQRTSAYSGFKGVHIDRRTGKFRANIGYKNRILYIGTYNTAEEAARAYDLYAIDLFGEFAFLNFKREGYNGAQDRP